jgi:putative transposase
MQKARMETSVAAYPTKYSSGYPDRFDSLADAQQWAQAFFTWYNHDHHHTGLGLFTPGDVHTGRAQELQVQRQAVLVAAYAAHPERFVRGPSAVPALPDAVWINPPLAQDSGVVDG